MDTNNTLPEEEKDNTPQEKVITGNTEDETLQTSGQREEKEKPLRHVWLNKRPDDIPKHDNNLYWTAIYCKARAEKTVRDRINELGLPQVEAYVPIKESVHQWSDRKKKVEERMFPSYVFVRARKTDYFKISHVEGAVMQIKFGDQAAVIPDKQIEYIKDIIANNIEAVVHNNAQLKKGVMAKIKSGPLSGYTGMLVSDCKDGNFQVHIEGINSTISIAVDRDLLEFVELPQKEKGLFNKK